MKKCLLISLIFYTNFSFSQLNDSFDDGDFTANPAWQGSTTAFKINTSGQLQTTVSENAGIQYLVTENALAANASWEFYVRLNFSPSASNFARIYLVSDKPDLNGALNGYFIHIGENGSADSFDLYRENGESVTLLIDGKDGRASTGVDTWIKVNRSKDGGWELFTKNKGETAYTSEGKATETNPLLTTAWFGVQCVYTKTRSDLFFFDNFRIGPYNNDNNPPGTEEPDDLESGTMAPGDILISEVLFNPRPEGVDFVEIVNHSDKLLDLADLSIATIRKDTLNSIRKISSTPVRCSPGQYMVLTTDPDNVKKEYYTEDPDAFLKMTSMPAYNNDAGTVVLLADSVVIDRFDYTEKMHFPLIKNPKGVSLERVSFERPANEAGNFRSAAGSVGYATPGYRNSQYTEERVSAEEVYLTSKTFSPDYDGFEDALRINYRFNEPGMVANITVYNDKGFMIRRLSKNLTLAQEGMITWDGLNENSVKPPVGIYIVYVEAFNTAGSVKRFRLPCVLAARL